MDNSVDRTFVAFGMTASGTTPLIERYVNGTFDKESGPTFTCEHYSTVTVRRGITVRLTIIDTPGVDDYGMFRRLAYERYTVHAALFCCLTNKLETFQNDCLVDYIAEFREFQPDVPIVLVGTMIDLRPVQTPKEKRIAIKTGQQVANKIGAVCYVECSALTSQGVREVFDKTIDACASKVMTTLERRSRKYLGIPVLVNSDDNPIDSKSMKTNKVKK